MLKKVLSLSLILVAVLTAATPVNGQRGLVRTLSAKVNGFTSMDVGVGLNYAQDHGFATNISKPGDSLASLATAHVMTGTIFMALGIAKFMDLAVNLPVYYDKMDAYGTVRDGGIGDLGISLKLLYPPPGEKRVFYQSYFLFGTIPTGNKESGIFPRHDSYEVGSPESKALQSTPFYSTEDGILSPMMLWSFDLGNAKKIKSFDFKINVNLGGVFSVDSRKNNIVLFNYGMEYIPVEPLSIFVDFSTRSRWYNFTNKFKWGSDPVMFSPGVRITTPVGLYIMMAGDFAIASRLYHEYWNTDHEPVKNWKYTTAVAPKYGFQLVLGWNGFMSRRDADGDNIKDDDDRCPKNAEDFDGFEDSDGCPDPDNDKDHIVDKDDKCPNVAEDFDGFEDSDGCPDLDNDRDGILDSLDKCPNVAEDFDGFEDSDGCPDLDNDRDGIPDSLDKCINSAEDPDGFEDSDGCPDPDNDKDGIPDLKDKCPSKPETFNSFEDSDGCPDEKPELTKAVEVKTSNMPKHQILEGVKFSSGSAVISYVSYRFIDPIVNEMLKYPDIRIEIRGHTDSMGRYESNMKLSKRRAESVRLYMIKKGIDPSRIRSVGFGPSSPIADNRTAAGRAKNRRIEIVRLQ